MLTASSKRQNWVGKRRETRDDVWPDRKGQREDRFSLSSRSRSPSMEFCPVGAGRCKGGPLGKCDAVLDARAKWFYQTPFNAGNGRRAALRDQVLLARQARRRRYLLRRQCMLIENKFVAAVQLSLNIKFRYRKIIGKKKDVTSYHLRTRSVHTLVTTFAAPPLSASAF